MIPKNSSRLRLVRPQPWDAPDYIFPEQVEARRIVGERGAFGALMVAKFLVMEVMRVSTERWTSGEGRRRRMHTRLEVIDGSLARLLSALMAGLRR